MNKHMRLPIDIELINHSGQIVLRVLFHREALRDWCLGLCLLKEGLVDSLVVTEERGTKGIKMLLRVTTDIGDRVRAKLKSDVTQLEVTPNSLGYLQHFFLKYYRDGVADVDHIDLEAVDADTGFKEIYITFRVPDPRVPVSPEEAERRLRG